MFFTKIEKINICVTKIAIIVPFAVSDIAMHSHAQGNALLDWNKLYFLKKKQKY